MAHNWKLHPFENGSSGCSCNCLRGRYGGFNSGWWSTLQDLQGARCGCYSVSAGSWCLAGRLYHVHREENSYDCECEASRVVWVHRRLSGFVFEFLRCWGRGMFTHHSSFCSHFHLLLLLLFLLHIPCSSTSSTVSLSFSPFGFRMGQTSTICQQLDNHA